MFMLLDMDYSLGYCSCLSLIHVCQNRDVHIHKTLDETSTEIKYQHAETDLL